MISFNKNRTYDKMFLGIFNHFNTTLNLDDCFFQVMTENICVFWFHKRNLWKESVTLNLESSSQILNCLGLKTLLIKADQIFPLPPCSSNPALIYVNPSLIQHSVDYRQINKLKWNIVGIGWNWICYQLKLQEVWLVQKVPKFYRFTS